MKQIKNQVDENQNPSGERVEFPSPAPARVRIPHPDLLPVRPMVQALASKDSWVRVVFYGKKAPTVAEIDRTIEILCLIRNGWRD